MGNSQPAKMFEKLIVIDCRGHLLGRLASFVAKEALAGQKIMLVRAEEINISGSFIRNKLHLLMRKQKRMSTNPRRGPFHHRSPADMLIRPIRAPRDPPQARPQVLHNEEAGNRDWMEIPI